MPITLDFDALVEEAERRIGAPASLPPHVAVGLRLLLDEVRRRNRLTREGRRLLQHEMLRVIIQRAAVEPALSEADDMVHGEVLVITGLPRTRSTLLHNLLADLGTFEWIPLWRALEPSLDPMGDGSRTALERAETQLRVMNGLSPDLLQVHPMRSDRPEECITPMQLTAASDRFSISLTVPEYHEWTQDAGVVAQTYRDYARLINVMFAGRGPILLKAPSHAANAAAFASHLRNPTFIWMIRDMDEVERSFERLVIASRTVFEFAPSGNDWRGRWRGLEPLPEALVLLEGEVFEYVDAVAHDLGVATPSASRHSDWLRPTPFCPAHPDR